ncbi:hypothetical protein E2R60_09005 [Paenibacillus dendritiformis]|uniref:hypothetical protein n=1 Tax=Paenibacillus dendritiformis TaxID=130049 RepID=UPI00105A920A|nr:hypothetical protein [Paenibacillus dendritiformis]TDL55678.1 hypothetical protein E2R60_09005 [Paenibacillus dendritiformis]
MGTELAPAPSIGARRLEAVTVSGGSMPLPGMFSVLSCCPFCMAVGCVGIASTSYTKFAPVILLY